MSHLDQPDESCSPQDMGGDAAKYQYPPPPGEGYEHTGAYYQPASSNSTVTLPSMPYDSQFLQPYGYSQDSRVNFQDSYRDAQQPLSDFGRDELGSWNGFQHVPLARSAPRQRAAIACRYCRRRKIRCSGFGDNDQGRCANCQRFQQECIFVPVSGQAQAFVPAHLAFTHTRNVGGDSDGGVHLLFPNVQQLYGAHGQHLRQIPPMAVDSPSNTAVPPTELFGSFADERVEGSRKRHREEPHSSILPPPIPGQLHHCQDSARRPAAEDNMHSPPVTLVAGLGLQLTPIYSPESIISSNSGLPNSLPPMSQFQTPPPKSSPRERYHPTASANIESRASEIDRNMLGRLDRKNC